MYFWAIYHCRNRASARLCSRKVNLVKITNSGIGFHDVDIWNDKILNYYNDNLNGYCLLSKYGCILM